MNIEKIAPPVERRGNLIQNVIKCLLLSLTNLGVLSQSSSKILTAAQTRFWNRNMNNILANISSNQNIDASSRAGWM